MGESEKKISKICCKTVMNKFTHRVVNLYHCCYILYFWDASLLWKCPFFLEMSRLVTKPTKWMCAQWRLRSDWADWSESSLSPWRKLGPLATHWAHSEDFDQTGRMPRLIWVFAGRTAILLVFLRGGSNVKILNKVNFFPWVKDVWLILFFCLLL